MSLSEWMSCVVLGSALCGGCLYFLSGNPSQKSVKLLCGLMMGAITVMPLGSLGENFQRMSEQACIFFDSVHTLETEESSLGETLILQTAEQRLSAMLQEEMERRLQRSDFRLGVSSDATAWLEALGEDFPTEQARLILSALLGGCDVTIKGGEKKSE